MDWLDLLAVQGTLKSLLQHHSSKASTLQCSAFFITQLSHPYMTTGKSTALTRWTFVCKVMPLLFNMLSRFIIAFLPRSKSGVGQVVGANLRMTRFPRVPILLKLNPATADSTGVFTWVHFHGPGLSPHPPSLVEESQRSSSSLQASAFRMDHRAPSTETFFCCGRKPVYP